MHTDLDTAHTWFVETLNHRVDGTLVVRLAEGVKLPGREPVEVGTGESLGPYHPVRVTGDSRCCEVRFVDVLAFYVFDESYSGRDLGLETDHTDRRRLSRVTNSALRRFIEQTTLLFDLVDKPVHEHHLWTEDRILQVFSSGGVTVVDVPEGPDLGIRHTNTFSAH